ncbi:MULTISPECIES: c-type cytochrome [Brevibacillus]|uniref:c-type cytochrome n=1 Tax=Brevibacillus TaxID=55080 RepID=UPI000D1050C0|nr:MULTISPECIES: c-type cytochrome [Brevibacillus]MED1944666.1 c-type cytochrome [Brevibacillus formosus]MED1996647.1 c-type cytochrome [Brevibacillus formosus]MED2081616.1 c-type cytochrome [Brevibacillus formosus]PSK12399.1 cytochrome C [Brevibacillus sp. NRRL NRS-603]
MKRIPLVLTAAVLAFSLSACGTSNQTQPPAQQPATDTPAAEQPATEAPSTTPSGSYDAATAETMYKNTCSGCHGQTLEGAVGPNLQKIGSQLNKDEIMGILEKGKGSMPPGLVTGKDAENIAAWLADKK